MTFQEIIQSDTPVLVDFFATWCGPCKAMAPALDTVKADLGDAIRIVKIDVDKNQELASQYQVQSIPTIMIFKNGALKWRETGVQSSTKLKSVIEAMD